MVRIDLDSDLRGWRPQPGQRDKYGREIPDRVYNQQDFDRELVLEKRTELVARKVTEFLRATDRFAKTIVFCEDIEHAERMRQELVNANADLAAENRRYVVRITGDAGVGKAELDNFIDPESAFPVIATTSKLLTTGVDAQTCRVIVLDQHIQSMAEFKQIIGRGTRINEEYHKLYFTILDFRNATDLFSDPQFDGDPVQIHTPGADESPVPPDESSPPAEAAAEEPVVAGVVFPAAGRAVRRVKCVVNNAPVSVIGERVEYYSTDGTLITESLKDYTRTAVQRQYASLEAFLDQWSKAEQKQAVVRELERQGVLFEALAEQIGRELDPFDLVCHLAFGRPALTRRERAAQARAGGALARYSPQARAVLDALLDKYADEGIEPIESLDVLRVPPFKQLGSPVELIKRFGGRPQYLQALRELEEQIYRAA